MSQGNDLSRFQRLTLRRLRREILPASAVQRTIVGTVTHYMGLLGLAASALIPLPWAARVGLACISLCGIICVAVMRAAFHVHQLLMDLALDAERSEARKDIEAFEGARIGSLNRQDLFRFLRLHPPGAVWNYSDTYADMLRHAAPRNSAPLAPPPPGDLANAERLVSILVDIGLAQRASAGAHMHNGFRTTTRADAVLRYLDAHRSRGSTL